MNITIKMETPNDQIDTFENYSYPIKLCVEEVKTKKKQKKKKKLLK